MSGNEDLRADFSELVKSFDALINAASLLRETTARTFTHHIALFAAQLVVQFAHRPNTTGLAFGAAVPILAPAASGTTYGRSYDALYNLLVNNTRPPDGPRDDAFTSTVLGAALYHFNQSVYGQTPQHEMAQEETPREESSEPAQKRLRSEPRL